jgi:hypothetical protein
MFHVTITNHARITPNAAKSFDKLTRKKSSAEKKERPL